MLDALWGATSQERVKCSLNSVFGKINWCGTFRISVEGKPSLLLLSCPWSSPLKFEHGAEILRHFRNDDINESTHIEMSINDL